VRLTQSQFDPIRVNERLWIVPSWHVAPDPGAINLVLDPALPSAPARTDHIPVSRVADQEPAGRRNSTRLRLRFGHLGNCRGAPGCRRVMGVDIDENALVAARDNAANNRVALELRHSRETIVEHFNIVVANILTNPLCVLASLLSAASRRRPNSAVRHS